MSIKKIVIFVIFFFSFLGGIKGVLALEVNYPSILGHSIDNTSNYAELACYIIGTVMDLSILIAVITIAYGGIYYLTSYGRGKFTSEAKDIIKAGILGLLIIVCATLIANTINSDLTSCKIGVLSFLGISTSSSNTVNPYNAPVVIYKEIPLGVLTETLLTRTMGCYGFDEEGNPIDGEEIITDDRKKGPGPTYMDHDRADCLSQLIDGADKKAQLVAALSAEITKLMNLCDCKTYGDCQPKCNPITGCQVTSFCPDMGGGSCGGECVGGACLSATAPDCCPTESKYEGVTVKQQIEHGPVPVEVDVGSSTSSDTCKTEKKEFKGLDEFRCPAPGAKITQCSGIADLVEKEVTVKEEKIRLIDPKKWEQLSLTQQLIYFKEKIDVFKEKIRADQAVLTQARDTLQSRQCYLSTPSVDLLRIDTTTDQKKEYIAINKIFSDPETNQKVSAVKYCDGFNYNNSSCFKKCNDECPDTSERALSAYSDIKDCAGKPYNSDCWSKQKADAKTAFGERPCALGDDAEQTYDGCINSCQGDCSEICAKKYLICSNDYKACEEQCINNSKCILDNMDTCLLSAQGFKNCSTDTSDPANTNKCINEAYLCKNGSDQYAGYPDCINSSFGSSSSSSYKCSTDQYSASYFYENNDCQKCDNPYNPAPTGSVCSTSASSSKKSCQDACPETSKCPTASDCLECSCNEIQDQSFQFIVPQESTKDNAGNAGYSTRDEKIPDDLSHQIVGPECNGYSYNDDPLTFYCQDEWWNNPKEGLNIIPVGTQRTCLPGGEIPVGQTIDNAQNWANNLIASADKMKQGIEDILTQMYKAGTAKDTPPVQNYCKCDAEFDYENGGGPICKTDCNYAEWWVEDTVDADGNFIPGYWQCSCIQTECEGNPCEQVIDYLSEIWNSYRQFKLDFIDFYMTMTTEPRSDIMKELTYSRSQTNKCSLVRNNYGTNSRLMSCTRVEAEVLSPIIGGSIIYGGKKVDSYCYGKNLNSSLTDNWFCCQTYSPGTESDIPIDINALP